MMKINKYLDLTKKALNVDSDSKLGNELGVTRSAISSYRTGRTAPDDFVCFQIGDILMIDPKKVIIDAKLEVEKDDFRKDFWKEKAKEYGFVKLPFLGLNSIAVGIVYILYKIRYTNDQGIGCKVVTSHEG